MKQTLTLLALAVLFLAGCDNPQNTADALRKEIAEFKANPNEKRQLTIDQSFVKLENQIQELEKRSDSKTVGLKDQLISLRADYQAAKVNKALNDAKNAIQGIGEAVKDSAKSIGEIFKGSGTNND
jgi:uncharacterized lipoprotein NlpE involved in copper resistance